MKAYILPTGNEILEGIVRDLDAPEMMRQIVAEWPDAEVTRTAPIIDEEDAIFKRICEAAETGADLIVLIGGSGGGHRFSKTLGRDFTHTALVRAGVEDISKAMAQAVFEKYPKGAASFENPEGEK